MKLWSVTFGISLKARKNKILLNTIRIYIQWKMFVVINKYFLLLNFFFSLAHMLTKMPHAHILNMGAAESSSDDDIGGMFGFSEDDCFELACQGIKPWDPEAGAALAVLNGYCDY